MKLRNINGIFLAVGIVYGISGAITVGFAQDSTAIDLEKRGRKALESEAYPEALEYFSEASAITPDTKTKSRLDFRQAVTLQQMAVKTELGDPEEQLRRAASLFRSFLAENPDSASAANNLAKTYEQLGNLMVVGSHQSGAERYFKLADENYQKALATKDSRQGLYLKSYSDFLEQTGNWEKAKESYALLIANYPLSPALRQSLANSYTSHGTKDLAEYLWRLLDAGYINQTTDFALDSLRDSLNTNDQGRVDLLTIVCASLAERADDYMKSLDLNNTDQGTSLLNDKFLGQGVREIVYLYKGVKLDRVNFKWWRSHGRNPKDPPIGLWPMDAFRALIRSLGSRSKRADNPKLAEKYFRFAAEIEPRNIDPIAVRLMVRMYAEEDEITKIDQTLNDYKIRLYESKGQAYRTSDAGKIFLYHQTLGELYALIGRWGDSETVGSAIFQLEHARDFSKKLAGSSPETLPEKYYFTPPMVESLATGYEKAGNPVKATKLRIDQAEFYQRANDTNAAIRVLSPVRETDLSPTYKKRYESLRARPELMLPVQKLNVETDVIKDMEGD